MLKLSALVSYHLQAASTSLNRLCLKPLATFMTIIVLALALTLPALFWVFSDNLDQLTADWQLKGRISLYLKTALSSSEEQEFLKKIRSTEGVSQAFLKSAGQNLAELQQQEGMQDIMHYLPQNPLPAVIDVIPNLPNPSSVQIKALQARLKTFPEVEQAKLDLQWVNRLHALLDFISKTAYALIALLASAVFLIVANTLRLEVHNRYEEIQILKLIGATDPFIARSFLYSGVWYSLAGAIFAVLFVNLFMLSLGLAVKQLASAYQMHYSITGLSVKQAYLLVLISTLLGWLGAKLSVKRQIASIEPYHGV